MINPPLLPACYTEQAWFDLEREKIFNKLWLFVGLTQQIQEEHSFITRQLNGVSVLVQREGGELRAFRNACAHRGMPIQTQECGQRKLVCPYHGWSYQADGKLRGIPSEKMFNICKNKRSSLSLETYSLKVIGSFIFINLDSDPLPIEKQYSDDVILLLSTVSEYFSIDVSYTHFTVSYNWKLNFENILDWHHASFVHQKTFAPLLQLKQDGAFVAAPLEHSLLFDKGARLAEIDFSTKLFTKPTPLKNISKISRTQIKYSPRWFSGLLENTLDIGALFNCILFPNVNFGSIHGEHFYLQQFIPIAPNKTEFHSWVFTAQLKPGVPPQPHLLWGIHHAEKQVIDEDVVVLTALQTALSSADKVGIMGDHEAPLAAVGEWYMNYLMGEKQ